MDGMSEGRAAQAGGGAGLRERKKARTREVIATTALRLFLESGFEKVSITQIAEEAEISRRTLFAYFPTKEDLVLQLFADHEDEAARAVRARRPGQPPLDALREALLDSLQRRDANTGLNDSVESVGFYQLVSGTESLAAGLTHYTARAIDALAAALQEAAFDPLTARLAASQVITVMRELANQNHQALAGGPSAADRYPEAVRAATHAFDLLRDGLGSLRDSTGQPSS